jgi:hypothetical protein
MFTINPPRALWALIAALLALALFMNGVAMMGALSHGTVLSQGSRRRGRSTSIS